MLPPAMTPRRHTRPTPPVKDTLFFSPDAPSSTQAMTPSLSRSVNISFCSALFLNLGYRLQSPDKLLKKEQGAPKILTSSAWSPTQALGDLKLLGICSPHQERAFLATLTTATFPPGPPSSCPLL